jgi:hypothetical protein
VIQLVIFVYLDEIIIYSSTIHEHLQHVKIILDRLKQHNLKIKLSKCKIAQKEVVYLIHTISKGTMKPSQEKVKDTHHRSRLNKLTVL